MDDEIINTENFHELIPDEMIINTAGEYNCEDKRDRYLSLKILFWGIILISTDVKRSIYPQIISILPKLFKKYGKGRVSVTRSALCKRYANMNYEIFKDIYVKTLEKYGGLLDTDLGKTLSVFKDVHIVDSTSIKLSVLLEEVFSATNKNKAALKIHTKFSLKKFVPIDIEVGSQKEHDSNYDFVSEDDGILYLTDLGYWDFDLFERIMNKGSSFVFRLKKGCVVRIEEVLFGDKMFEGKTLSEVIPFINTDLIDLKVKLNGISKPLRVVGLKHEGEWYFYLTCIFDERITPEIIYQIYRLRWIIELVFNDLKNAISLKTIAGENKNVVMIEIYAGLLFFLLTRIIMVLAAKKLTAEQKEKICTEKIVVNETEKRDMSKNTEKEEYTKEIKEKVDVKELEKPEDGYSIDKCVGYVKANAYDLFESIILHNREQLEDTLLDIIYLINSQGFIEGRQGKKALSGVT